MADNVLKMKILDLPEVQALLDQMKAEMESLRAENARQRAEIDDYSHRLGHEVARAERLWQRLAALGAES